MESLNTTVNTDYKKNALVQLQYGNNSGNMGDSINFGRCAGNTIMAMAPGGWANVPHGNVIVSIFKHSWVTRDLLASLSLREYICDSQVRLLLGDPEVIGDIAGNFNNGKLNGHCVCDDYINDIKIEGNFTDNKRNGIFVITDNKNDKKYSIVYRDDKMQPDLGVLLYDKDFPTTSPYAPGIGVTVDVYGINGSDGKQRSFENDMKAVDNGKRKKILYAGNEVEREAGFIKR